jgi:hypothetical protein
MKRTDVPCKQNDTQMPPYSPQSAWIQCIITVISEALVKQSNCALNRGHLVPSYACDAARERTPANLRNVAEQVAPHKHGEGHFPEVSTQDDGVKGWMKWTCIVEAGCDCLDEGEVVIAFGWSLQ